MSLKCRFCQHKEDDSERTVLFDKKPLKDPYNDYYYYEDTGELELAISEVNYLTIHCPSLNCTKVYPYDKKESLFNYIVKTSADSPYKEFPLMPSFFVEDLVEYHNLICSYCSHLDNEPNYERKISIVNTNQLDAMDGIISYDCTPLILVECPNRNCKAAFTLPSVGGETESLVELKESQFAKKLGIKITGKFSEFKMNLENLLKLTLPDEESKKEFVRINCLSSLLSSHLKGEVNVTRRKNE